MPARIFSEPPPQVKGKAGLRREDFRPGGSLWGDFYKFERELVALADLEVTLAVERLQPQAGRKGPYALGMVLGVPGVGGNLGPGDEPEAGLLDQGDHVVLAQIAGLELFGGRAGRVGTVVHHAEHAAGLEHTVEFLDHLVGVAVGDPVVQVHEGQQQVGGVGRDAVRQAGAVGDADLAVERGLAGDAPLDGFVLGPGGRRVVGAGVEGGDVLPGVTQVGGEDFEPPGTDAGPDLDNREPGLEAEEGQRLGGLACRVPGAVGLAALGAVEPVLQRAVGGVGGPQEGQAEQGGQKEVLEAAHGACSVGRQSRGGPL